MHTSAACARHAAHDIRPPYKRLWLGCFLGYAAIGATIQVMPAFVSGRLGAGVVASGAAVTIGSLATMVARPIAGRIADGRGARRVVLTGTVLGVAGGVGHLLASSYAMLIVARLLLGAGEGALFTGAIGWVLASAAAEVRGRTAGHFGLSMWSGLAGGPILGGMLLAFADVQAVWIVASVLPLASLLLVVTMPTDTPSAKRAAARAWLPRAAWRPGLGMALASVGYGVIAAFLVPHFGVARLPGRGVVLAVFGGAFLLARFLGSPMIDRLGARRVFVTSVLVEAVGLAVLGVATSSTQAFAATMIAGVGLSLLYPALAAIVADRAVEAERTAAIGVMTSAWDLGLALGGPVGGLVAGETLREPFIVASVLALAAILPFVARRCSGGSIHSASADTDRV